MNRRWTVAAIGVLALGVGLSLALPRAAAEGDGIARARLLTGPEGGTYFALGKLLEQRKREGLMIRAAASDGSIGNLIMTSVGRAEISFVQADVLSFMRGQAEYQAAMKKIEVVLPLWREEIHVLVNRKAEIASLAALKGKRLNIGVGASGSSLSAAVILHAIGLDEDALSVSQHPNDEALNELRAGKIDAMLVTGGAPLPFLAKLAKSDEETIELLGIDAATSAKLTADMPFWTAKIPAQTYPWQAKEVVTVATLCLLVAREGAPAVTIERVAKAVLAEAPELAKVHPKWGEVDRALAKSLAGGADLKFHAGAKKALEE